MKRIFAVLAVFALGAVSNAVWADNLVFGPYGSGSLDSSVCGNDWANDTYSRTYAVTPQSDGSFEVTELFQGEFTTLAGPSPNDCSTIRAGIKGKLYGNEAFRLPPGADFNFTAKCPDGCNGTEFFAAFFGIPDYFSTPAGQTYAWQFHYRTDHNGTWDNTDHGNTGNIHN